MPLAVTPGSAAFPSISSRWRSNPLGRPCLPSSGEGPPPFQHFETVCLSTPHLLATSEELGLTPRSLSAFGSAMRFPSKAPTPLRRRFGAGPDRSMW